MDATQEDRLAVCVRRANEALSTLLELDERALEQHIQSNKRLHHDLLMSMGGLIGASCGQLNKLYEKAAALRLALECEADAEHVVVQHVAHHYGPDITVHDARTATSVAVEVKNSAVTAAKRFRSNWVFTLRFAEAGARRLFYVQHLTAQYRGVVLLVATQGKRELASYRLSGHFVALYLAQKCLQHGEKKTIVVNLGCAFCERHATYHKIEKLMEYDRLLCQYAETFSTEARAAACVGYFSIDDWAQILAPTRPCKG
jgi:hypothetical protein